MALVRQSQPHDVREALEALLQLNEWQGQLIRSALENLPRSADAPTKASPGKGRRQKPFEKK